MRKHCDYDLAAISWIDPKLKLAGGGSLAAEAYGPRFEQMFANVELELEPPQMVPDSAAHDKRRGRGPPHRASRLKVGIIGSVSFLELLGCHRAALIHRQAFIAKTSRVWERATGVRARRVHCIVHVFGCSATRDADFLIRSHGSRKCQVSGDERPLFSCQTDLVGRYTDWMRTILL